MRKIALLLVAAMTSYLAVMAQKENNVWAFGDSMGIDFNGASPEIIQTSIRTLGGSASVCDANGQLLFYTQGDFIWNRNHQLMPAGSGLISPYASNDGTQSAQGQLILPVINNPDQYYVFSMQTVTDYMYGGDINASRLYYSIIDMSLDGGLGDVVPTRKGILLDSMLTSEKMIAIQGTGCNVWLLVHQVEDNTFKAFHVGDTGISTTPVVSVSGNMTTPLAYTLGKMKASPDGTRLAVCNWLLGSYGCELYDFDPATGTVSNPQVLDSIPQSISACFSPDGSRLYVFSFDGGNGAMYQYDLSQANIGDVIASATLIDQLNGPGTSVFDAQIGPDGKVYVKMPYSGVSRDTIGRIDAPDLAGTACAYTRAALTAPRPIMLGNGDLPNMFVKPAQDTSYVSGTISLETDSSVTLEAPAGYNHYTWNNGDTTASVTVDQAGTYWVTSWRYCSYRTDTFVVAVPERIHDAAAVRTEMQLSPNPAGSHVTIRIAGGPAGEGYIRIADMTGRLIYSTPVSAHRIIIPLQDIADGVYLVMYDDGRYVIQEKLVITR